MTKLNIKIIVGSTRPNRFSEKPANWIYQELKKREEVEAELLDLRDYPLPFFNEPKPPTMTKGDYSSELVKNWAEKIQEADGFIIVSPEYNHGYPAVLKNALDYIYYEWNRKPVGFISYGSAAGARAVEQLRQVAVELEMAPIRNAVHIFAPSSLLDEKGNLITDTLQEKADKMVNELIWWTNALKVVRQEDHKI